MDFGLSSTGGLKGMEGEDFILYNKIPSGPCSVAWGLRGRY
jgi:hypothetical protein